MLPHVDGVVVVGRVPIAEVSPWSIGQSEVEAGGSGDHLREELHRVGITDPPGVLRRTLFCEVLILVVGLTAYRALDSYRQAFGVIVGVDGGEEDGTIAPTAEPFVEVEQVLLDTPLVG